MGAQAVGKTPARSGATCAPATPEVELTRAILSPRLRPRDARVRGVAGPPGVDVGSTGQSATGPPGNAVPARAATARRDSQSRPDRAEQRVLASVAVPGLQADPAPPQGDSLPAVGPGAGDAATGRSVEVGSAGLLHAALGTPADDHTLPDGDHPASRAEAHRDDLRGRHAHLAGDLHGRPAAP